MSYRFECETGGYGPGRAEVRLTPRRRGAQSAGDARRRAGHQGGPVRVGLERHRRQRRRAHVTCIQELRRALADDSRQPRFIETRHRRGYRFVAPLAATAADAVADRQLPAHDVSAIAVLPFADMSPGRDQDYLCEGLAEELINALTHIDGLRVASRTASFQFRAAGADVRAVGRHLGVGSAARRQRSQGGRSAARDGPADRSRHRLSPVVAALRSHARRRVCDPGRDRGERRDVAARQRPERAREAGAAAAADRRGGVRVLPARPAAPAPHDAAGPGDERASMFERAIELDAGYGPAFAGLATVHATLYEWFGARDEDLAQRGTRQRTGAGTGARAWPKPTWRAAARCRCRGATTRRRANSRRPFASIPICSMRTTTSPEPASRAATSQRSAELFRQGGRGSPGGLPEPDAAGAVAAHGRTARKKRAAAGREGIRARRTRCSC